MTTHAYPPYWRHETSGVLAAAVAAYLDNATEGKPITADQVAIMQIYLSQWIDSPVWEIPRMDAELRGELQLLRMRAKLIQSSGDIHRWLEDAMELGIDPL